MGVGAGVVICLVLFWFLFGQRGALPAGGRQWTPGCRQWTPLVVVSGPPDGRQWTPLRSSVDPLRSSVDPLWSSVDPLAVVSGTPWWSSVGSCPGLAHGGRKRVL